MKVTIVDYGSGNLRSVAKAFAKAADLAAADLNETVDILVSQRPEDVASADRVVLPGVGAYGECLRGIAATAGLREALETFAMHDARPFLGICVGMQLMADTGVEHGTHQGFGWIGGQVSMIKPADPALKIPHMGWNELEFLRPHPVLAGLGQGLGQGLEQAPAPHAYFVHSYAMAVSSEDDLVATTDYDGPVTAMIARDNLIGTQFHPEKSQAFGLGLIAGFLKWKP